MRLPYPATTAQPIGAVALTPPYEELIGDGHIKAEDFDTEKAKNTAFKDKVFEMATSVVYQLSTGQRRIVDVTSCELYEVLRDLVDDDGENFDDDSSIILQSEGYHRAVFINPNAVDYISIPTHLLEKSRDNMSAAMLDEFGDNDK